MKISPYHDKTILPADSTWGAYQHYGNPNAFLVRERKSSPPQAKTQTKKRTATKPRAKTAAKPKAKTAKKK